MKLSDFFIGLYTFFAYILPGAVFLMIVLPGNLSECFDLGRESWKGKDWFVVFTFSYIAGHVIYGLSALSLAWSYEWIYLKSDILCNKKSKEYLENKKSKAGDLAGETEDLLRLITLKLVMNEPNVIEDLQQVKADSKLFRSLTLVFAVAALTFACNVEFGWAVVFFLLSFTSIARYWNRHKEHETRSYEYAIEYFEKAHNKTGYC